MSSDSHSQTEAVANLIRSIASFLKTAVAGRVPARDVPTAEAICSQLAPLLQEDSVALLELEVGRSLAAEFAHQPTDWSQVGLMVYLHFQIDLPTHVGAPQSTGRKFDPTSQFILSALREATREERDSFYQNMNNHFHVSCATARAFEELDSPLEEIERFLEALAATRETIPEAIVEHLVGWARRKPQRALELIDRQTQNGSQLTAVSTALALVLVVALARGLVGDSVASGIAPS